jgi:hypothetical protein
MRLVKDYIKQAATLIGGRRVGALYLYSQARAVITTRRGGRAIVEQGARGVQAAVTRPLRGAAPCVVKVLDLAAYDQRKWH